MASKVRWIAQINSKFDIVQRGIHIIIFQFSTFARPHYEYYCPLWSLHTDQYIMKTEAPHTSIAKKIDDMTGLDYWIRPEKLNLYSAVSTTPSASCVKYFISIAQI